MRSVVFWAVVCGALLCTWCGAVRAAERPNFVIIFADDLGYGDLGCFGNPTIATPHLDRMAAEGTKLTQFYSAASVCTPSRAALMTGRLPVRTGMCGDRRRVLFPNSPGGLPDSEITLAEALHDAGYRTACVGKWHLGHHPRYLPTRHGFDSYFGIPYSNDMKPSPLLRNETVIEEPAEQTTLTKRYTEAALEFIETPSEQPFFLYFAHTFPHIPLYASDEFLGKSRRGLFGDVVEELDASVGAVLDALRSKGLAENTYVVFTSDNGPWLVMDERGGTAGQLRDGKGATFEGGMREPTIVWGPGRIPAAATSAAMGATLDILPTFLALAGIKPDPNRALDGYDLSGAWQDGEPSPREEMYYYRGTQLMAVRLGAWKVHYMTQPSYGPGSFRRAAQDPPLLYQLEHDPSERFDLSRQNPEVIAQAAKLVERHRMGLKPTESQLDRRE